MNYNNLNVKLKPSKIKNKNSFHAINSQANTHPISEKEVTKIKNTPKWAMPKEVCK